MAEQGSCGMRCPFCALKRAGRMASAVVAWFSVWIMALALVSPTQAQEGGRGLGNGRLVLLDTQYNSMVNMIMQRSLEAMLGGLGFQTRVQDGPFDAAALAGADMLIIATALAPRNETPPGFQATTPEESEAATAQAWRLPVDSAFSDDEIAALVDWVDVGGALIVMSDHMPFGGAVAALTRAFGVETCNCFVVDPRRLSGLSSTDIGQAAMIPYRREDGSLADHPITNGLAGGAPVRLTMTLTGNAFRLPETATSLMTLAPGHEALIPEVAWQFTEDTPRESVAGWSQYAVMPFGQGRVAFIGEFGMLARAQAFDVPGMETPPGVDPAQVQNQELFLNTLHWLMEPDE